MLESRRPLSSLSPHMAMSGELSRWPGVKRLCEPKKRRDWPLVSAEQRLRFSWFESRRLSHASPDRPGTSSGRALRPNLSQNIARFWRLRFWGEWKRRFCFVFPRAVSLESLGRHLGVNICGGGSEAARGLRANLAPKLARNLGICAVRPSRLGV